MSRSRHRVYVPSLVLIAQAIFLLEQGYTQREIVADACTDGTAHASSTANVVAWRLQIKAGWSSKAFQNQTLNFKPEMGGNTICSS